MGRGIGKLNYLPLGKWGKRKWPGVHKSDEERVKYSGFGKGYGIEKRSGKDRGL